MKIHVNLSSKVTNITELLTYLGCELHLSHFGEKKWDNIWHRNQQGPYHHIFQSLPQLFHLAHGAPNDLRHRPDPYYRPNPQPKFYISWHSRENVHKSTMKCFVKSVQTLVHNIPTLYKTFTHFRIMYAAIQMSLPGCPVILQQITYYLDYKLVLVL